jgi:hypothetical protein
VDSVALDRGEIGCSHSSGGGTIKGKAYWAYPYPLEYSNFCN